MNSTLVRFLLLLGILALLIFVMKSYLVPQLTNSQNGWVSELMESFSGVLDGSYSNEGSSNDTNQMDMLEVNDNLTNKNKIHPTTEREKQSLYRWIDEKGNTQYTQELPDENIDYEVVSYRESKKQLSSTSQRFPRNYSQLPKTQRVDSKKSSEEQKNTGEVKPSFEIPLQCKAKYSRLSGYEKKLSRSKEVVESIWLQDYCTALSELIQEGCVVPKKVVKFNQYCPVRYR